MTQTKPIAGSGTGVMIEGECPVCDIKPRMFAWSPVAGIGVCKACSVPVDMRSEDAPVISPEWLPLFRAWYSTTRIPIIQEVIWGITHKVIARANLQDWLDANAPLWPQAGGGEPVQVYECVAAPSGALAFIQVFPTEDPRPRGVLEIEAVDVGIGRQLVVTISGQ